MKQSDRNSKWSYSTQEGERVINYLIDAWVTLEKFMAINFLGNKDREWRVIPFTFGCEESQESNWSQTRHDWRLLCRKECSQAKDHFDSSWTTETRKMRHNTLSSNPLLTFPLMLADLGVLPGSWFIAFEHQTTETGVCGHFALTERDVIPKVSLTIGETETI